MTKLLWDQVGERRFETGVDRGVLYLPTNGDYSEGHAWNGLTTVTESPSGADASPQYADNIKYLNLIAAESFGATIEAFTYPDAFAQCDGSATPAPGIAVGQQSRRQFGLAYRTKIGNDVDGSDAGYKIHLVYGALAAPSQKAYTTVNDSPAALAFSWDVTTTPVAVDGLKPTAFVTIDSTKVSSASLTALEDALYGTNGTDARLPLPDEVIAMFGGALTTVNPTQPTFDAGTGVITIPAQSGVQFRRSDTNAVVTGTVTIPAGSSLVINSRPTNGYVFGPNVDDDWEFTRPA